MRLKQPWVHCSNTVSKHLVSMYHDISSFSGCLKMWLVVAYRGVFLTSLKKILIKNICYTYVKKRHLLTSINSKCLWYLLCTYISHIFIVMETNKCHNILYLAYVPKCFRIMSYKCFGGTVLHVLHFREIYTYRSTMKKSM